MMSAQSAQHLRPLRPRSRRYLRVRRAGLALTLTAAAGLLAGALQLGCGSASQASGDAGVKVIVLGIDGMDYNLTRQYMDAGILPNFSRLAREGRFTALGTSVPPLSPVAWSDFITGMDAGGHGIFDFIHRDPQTMVPYLSTSRPKVKEPTQLPGCWQLPGAGEIELLRRGEAFWEALEQRGVTTTILRMPANFPPSGTASHELSGMGTPDVLGTYGTFSFYTSELFAFGGKEVSGGNVYEAWPEDGVVRAKLYGPDNPFRSEADKGCKGEKLAVDFTVYVDQEAGAARLEVGDEVRLLKVGEWSDWVPLAFDMVPTQSLPITARFYLRQLQPEFELYVSPLNFDPMSPAQPISTPHEYAAELAEATGRYYTQGMPEDTKALTEGVFTPDDFLAQAKIAGGEVIHQYGGVLDRFLKEQGDRLLFYYFGNIDQVSHVMYRAIDPEHPAYDEARDKPYAHVIEELYRQADEVVGHTLEHLDPDTRLIVMSDHGFAPWRRAFNLNTWLKDNGYITLKNPKMAKDPGLFLNVDWARTRAYGLGFNGLYVNLQGRERRGVVGPEQRRALIDEIAAKLLQVVDPATGEPAITKVYPREVVYKDRGELDIGPDLLVGYARGTRVSNQSTLGEITAEQFSDNTEAWSGDHGMDHETVPGVLFTLKPLKKEATSLRNLAAAIVAEFGIESFPAPSSGREGE